MVVLGNVDGLDQYAEVKQPFIDLFGNVFRVSGINMKFYFRMIRTIKKSLAKLNRIS